ncbi:MAG: tripartite tricarboxylate transporter substrate-binding protein [Bacteroidota bacterium]
MEGVFIVRLKKCLFKVTSVLYLLTICSSYCVAKPFYDGETISLIVATKPGGGYDFYGRLIGKYMQEYLPGSKVIIKNVPGAGHIIGTNEIYHAKPDGLTFGTFNRAIPFTQVAELKGVKFNVTKMSWLGSATPEVYCLIVTNKFETLNDVIKADEIILAKGGAGNLSHLAAELFIELSAMNNVKTVGGYLGNEGELAMIRGEVDGQFASFASIEQLIKDGHARPVMFIAKTQPEGYENVPLLSDVIKEEKYQPVVNLLLSVNLLGRPFAGPPGIPDDRLKVLRDAFERACKNPDLIKIVRNSRKHIEYTSGDDAQKLVSSIMRIPPEILLLIKKSYGLEGN